MEGILMYSFTVNGKLVETEKEVSLLRFLRDDLKLKSIKDGCSQGVYKRQVPVLLLLTVRLPEPVL